MAFPPSARSLRFLYRNYFTESECTVMLPGIAKVGDSISSLRIIRLVAFSVASSNPCP